MSKSFGAAIDALRDAKVSTARTTDWDSKQKAVNMAFSKFGRFFGENKTLREVLEWAPEGLNAEVLARFPMTGCNAESSRQLHDLAEMALFIGFTALERGDYGNFYADADDAEGGE